METELTVSCGPVIKCFIILPNSKIEKNCENKICLTQAGTQICQCFKVHDLFLVSFVCPRELSEF